MSVNQELYPVNTKVNASGHLEISGVDLVKLAEKLLAAAAVPHTSFDDAVHIAAATVHGMDYLVTWNCKHIANVYTKPLIYRCCEENGFKCPAICTPPEMEGGDDNV